MKLTDTFVVNETKIEVALADLTTADTDVIVNSLCEYLHIGYGVSGAILDKGGGSIYEELSNCEQPVPGSVLVTKAGDLPHKNIYHAISSVCKKGTTKDILEDCVNNTLRLARENKMESIAFPALGAGEMNFDIKEAAKVLIQSVVNDSSKNAGIKRILFCLYKPNAFTSFFREAVKQTVKDEINSQSRFENNIESDLLKSLKNCKYGKNDWKEYEDISINLFKYLFVPPLSEPRIQARNENGLHIRDAIFSNFSENGFWHIIDSRYKANCIVFECKNHGSRIGQDALNQMGKYLKGDALGKIGFIATRIEPSEEAFKARNELFRDLKAIVLFIDDFDFQQMVELKKIGTNPEEYIKRKLEDFLIAY